MKYAVLGTGMVGHTLATKLASLGHGVRMGARSANNEKAVAWAEANGAKAGQGSFAEVATWADRVIFAVNGGNIVAVADAVLQVISAAPGTRPFRTEVDRIGMAEPLKAYNDHLAQVTTGLFTNLGMEDMLTLKTGGRKAA